MTDKQLKQAKSQLSQGERFDRVYSAYEGLISKKAAGAEMCYDVFYFGNWEVASLFLMRPPNVDMALCK